MKTVAVEDLVASTILTFCENAAELGCPKNRDVDMWFRELSEEDMFKVGDKLLRIQERDILMSKTWYGCYGLTGSISDEENEEKEESDEDIPDELDDSYDSDDFGDSDGYVIIDDDIVDDVLSFARSRVVNDRQTLLNYGVNEALKEIIASDGANLEIS